MYFSVFFFFLFSVSSSFLSFYLFVCLCLLVCVIGIQLVWWGNIELAFPIGRVRDVDWFTDIALLNE